TMVPIARLGKYNLVDQIGRGAMGEVFSAHDPDLDRYVALKVIAAGDADTRLRFRREAQSAARLVHPNIVVVHDFGEESGRFFMAMELLDGSELKRLIQSGAFPSLGARLHVMEQICDAMAFAHSTNIVHRDLRDSGLRQAGYPLHRSVVLRENRRAENRGGAHLLRASLRYRTARQRDVWACRH